MKKISVITSGFLCCLLMSCGGGSSPGQKEAGATAEANRQAMGDAQAMAARPVRNVRTIPAPQGLNLFNARLANVYIANYDQSNRKLEKNSFVFRSQELLDYLNAAGSSIVNFIIGSNGDDSLFLFLAPVDRQGRHEFYERNDTCYVLCENFNVTIPTTLEPGAATIDTFFVEALDTNHAKGMIASYESAGSLQKKNNGWLYNANDLRGYLTAGLSAPGGMEYVQFVMGMTNDGKIDLIIVGSNDGQHHMYFEYNGKCNVMENADPCPDCNTASGGTMFDTPTCQY